MMSPKAEALFKLASSKNWRMRNMHQIYPEETDAICPYIRRFEQEEFARQRHTRNIIPKVRKIGYSTELVLSNGDDCLFTPGMHCAIVDFKEKDAWKKLDIFRTSWQNGPKHPNALIAEMWRGIHQKLKLVIDNAGCMEWSNGSRFEAGMSFMGGTPKRLHVSEFGPLAAQRPHDAIKVRRGSFAAVPKSGIIDVETTMEGGKFGECYALFEKGLQSRNLKELSQLHWKFHFHPWMKHPHYDLPGMEPQHEETKKYFASLAEAGISVPLSRQAWYEVTADTQGGDMFTQYPSTESECVNAPVAGAVYAIMTDIRAKGQIGLTFECDPAAPMVTSWDIGISDFMSGWLFQKTMKYLVHDWCEAEGEDALWVAKQIVGWKKLFPKVLRWRHCFPHDAGTRSPNDKQTFMHHIAKHLKRLCADERLPYVDGECVCIQRTNDRWKGIQYARKTILPKAIFHARTERQRYSVTRAKMPSGVTCLESYRKAPPSTSGSLHEEPVHDMYSHSADAFRCFAEADMRGVVDASYISIDREERELESDAGISILADRESSGGRLAGLFGG